MTHFRRELPFSFFSFFSANTDCPVFFCFCLFVCLFGSFFCFFLFLDFVFSAKSDCPVCFGFFVCLFGSFFCFFLLFLDVFSAKSGCPVFVFVVVVVVVLFLLFCLILPKDLASLMFHYFSRSLK